MINLCQAIMTDDMNSFKIKSNSKPSRLLCAIGGLTNLEKKKYVYGNVQGNYFNIVIFVLLDDIC